MPLRKIFILLLVCCFIFTAESKNPKHMVTAIIIDSILLAILIILIIVKTLHFYKYVSTKRRKFVNWLYFSHNAVIRSHSSKSVDNKRRQNAYSVRIGVMLIVIVCAVVLEFLILDQTLPNAKPSERPTAPTIKR